MSKIAITIPCPTCGTPAHYVSALDRYVHADGSSNQDCWRTLLGGKPAPRRDDPSTVTAPPPIYVPQAYPLFLATAPSTEPRPNICVYRVIAWLHVDDDSGPRLIPVAPRGFVIDLEDDVRNHYFAFAETEHEALRGIAT